MARPIKARPTSEDIKFRAAHKKRKGGGGGRRVPVATIRCNELERIFQDRYGRPQLPDDDAGHDDAEIMLNHIAHRTAVDIQWLMDDWLDRWAPWLVGLERGDLVAQVLRHPIKYKPATLGQKLGLPLEARTRLGITMIRAIGQTSEDMKQARAQMESKRKREKRRAAGCKTRAEYLTGSVTAKQPWKAMGLGRTKYYEMLKVGKLSAVAKPDVAA